MTTIADTLASLERLTNAAELKIAHFLSAPMLPHEAVEAGRLRQDVQNVRRLADRLRQQAEGLETTHATPQS